MMAIPRMVCRWCKLSVIGGIIIYVLLLLRLQFEIAPPPAINYDHVIVAGFRQDHVTGPLGRQHYMKASRALQELYVTPTQKRHQHVPLTSVRQLIILSHPRSGSSLTGDIMQHADQSFYVFEPLHALEYMLANKIPSMRLLKGDKVMINHANFISRSLAIIEAYMTCDFQSLDHRMLIDGMHLMSHKYVPFLSCVDRQSNSSGDTEQSLTRCLPLLEKACRSSGFIVIKTVRLSMAHLESLMVKYPNLHILHLMRDPRAVLFSKSKFGINITMNSQKKARLECRSMIHNINTTWRYSWKFPNRVDTLYYENLALRPLETSETLYRHHDLTFTESIRYHIYTLTSAGHEPKCSPYTGLCLESSNSSKNANLWKTQLTGNIISIIDKSCSTLYKITNYFYRPMMMEYN
ncbi:carbohydrate sulfotransferase 1-like isoform X2 [Argopecten irradians]|uniref:carbohydrate sulfotransferase 1-like isoform X2 n=1 Tax=Argopecten irradians TaxID=31199 RepID=UPI00371DCC69